MAATTATSRQKTTDGVIATYVYDYANQPTDRPRLAAIQARQAHHSPSINIGCHGVRSHGPKGLPEFLARKFMATG
jgi:hypothetical protein